jgi:acyl carrier protein
MSVPTCTSASTLNLRNDLRGFILESLAQPKGITSFSDSDLLMESGIIDSLDIFRLVAFLEDQLGVRIDDQEINPETLRSLNTIEELVIRKRGLQ